MAADWYYQVMGEMFGPIGSSDLKAKAKAGEITAETLVKKGENGHWVSALRVDGLFPKVPPPLPSPPVDNAITVVPRPTRREHRQQKSLPKYWWFGLIALLLLFGTGAAIWSYYAYFSPTSRFQRFASEASSDLLACFEEGAELRNAGFDVEKTDSIVSPYRAKFVYVVARPVTEGKVLEAGLATYLYQDHRWILKGTELDYDFEFNAAGEQRVRQWFDMSREGKPLTYSDPNGMDKATGVVELFMLTQVNKQHDPSESLTRLLEQAGDY